MKKGLAAVISLVMAAILLAGCGGGGKAKGVAADVDLTQMSYVMAYAQINAMKSEADTYMGKTVKVDGIMATYDMSYIREDKKNYYCVCKLDDTGCCQTTFEFILESGSTDPADYPKTGDEVTVVGTFDTYEVNGFVYCYLKDATVYL